MPQQRGHGFSVAVYAECGILHWRLILVSPVWYYRTAPLKCLPPRRIDTGTDPPGGGI